MDIDEILSRAEDQQIQADQDQSLSLEQELLSKFKVCVWYLCSHLDRVHVVVFLDRLVKFLMMIN